VSSIAAIVLSAGESKRFGSPKALAQFGEKTALQKIIDVAIEAKLSPVVVVLGAHVTEIQKMHSFQECKVVLNKDHWLGQTSSLQAGLRALPSQVLGAALFLVDHPLATVSTVLELAKRFAKVPKTTVRPIWNERGGHPTFLPSSLFADLLALDPKTSARELILSGKRLDVLVEDPGVRAEFDTKDEYEKLKGFGDTQ